MTFQRVLRRNGLHDGDYGRPPSAHPAGSGPMAFIADAMTMATAMASLRDAVARQEETRAWAARLAGDLRRLERDALDERGICAQIAARTGIAPDVVAAVLKEFVAL